MSLHPKGGFYQISQLWEVGCADVALLLQSLDNVNKVWEFINCVPLIGQSVVTFRLLRLLKLLGTPKYILSYEAQRPRKLNYILLSHLINRMIQRNCLGPRGRPPSQGGPTLELIKTYSTLKGVLI